MLPAPIGWFQRLLLGAIAIDIVNNLLARAALAAAFAARGAALPPMLVVALCLLPAGIGGIGWYLVVRRRSAMARWLVSAIVGASALALVGLLASGRLPFVLATQVALFTAVLKLAAVSRLHTEAARRWFGYSSAA